MNEENDTGKHEFNFFLDKQIQQKLLEADEIIAAKETAVFKSAQQTTTNGSVSVNSSNVAGTSKNNPPKPVKDSLRANISGWCSGPGIVYRKTESDVPSRGRGQPGLRDALSRDSRFRPQTHNPTDFVFRHYSDPRKYIEQYRKEHTCYDTTTTSATRSEFLDTRRFYAYNQYSPLAVGAQNNAPATNSSLPPSFQDPPASTPEQSFFNQKKQQQPQQQAPTLQYTNRREQSKQTISANLRPSNLYKLSKSNTTNLEKAKTPDLLQEVGIVLDQSSQQKRPGSARGSAGSGVNGVNLQRNSTTTDIDRLSARCQKTPTQGVTLDSTSSNQFIGRKLGQIPSGQTRTLDALTCPTPIGGKQISGDSETASSAQDTWPCPEVRLELSGRRGRAGRAGRGVDRNLVQPTVTAPQLAFIKEGDEVLSSSGLTSGNFEGSRSSTLVVKDTAISKGGKNNGGGEAAVLKGGNVVGPEEKMAAAGTSDGDSCGSSNPSSLQPNGGSSVRTSNSSGSSSNNNTHSKNRRRAGRAKSEEPARIVHDLDKSSQGDACDPKLPVTSTSSTPASHLFSDHMTSLSWRERVQQQQQKTVTSSGDATGDTPYLTANRWAVARRHEELSSVAHARRIKHLIEQSRHRGGASLGQSVVEDSGRGKGNDQRSLRVEGQQPTQPTLSHISSSSAAAVMDSCLANKGDNTGGDVEGLWAGVLPSPHPVLPPVRKTRGDGKDNGPGSDPQHRQRGPDKPVLGDVLDAQSFFSHGISLCPTDSGSKKQQHHHHHHYHLQQRFTPPEKHSPTVSKQTGLSRPVGPLGPGSTSSRITLATAAVIGEPPQPRLKYTAAFQHKLTGGCLP